MERHRKAYTGTTHTSRRTYLLARFGWGAIGIGLLHFFFATGPQRWLAFDIGCVVAGVLLIMLSSSMRKKKKVDPDAFDENGNAKKKVL